MTNDDLRVDIKRANRNVELTGHPNAVAEIAARVRYYICCLDARSSEAANAALLDLREVFAPDTLQRPPEPDNAQWQAEVWRTIQSNNDRWWHFRWLWRKR